LIRQVIKDKEPERLNRHWLAAQLVERAACIRHIRKRMARGIQERVPSQHTSLREMARFGPILAAQSHCPCSISIDSTGMEQPFSERNMARPTGARSFGTS
jgi:hypothetical protein